MFLDYGILQPAAPRRKARAGPTYQCLLVSDTRNNIPQIMWNCKLTSVYTWLDLIRFHFEFSKKIGQQFDDALGTFWWKIFGEKIEICFLCIFWLKIFLHKIVDVALERKHPDVASGCDTSSLLTLFLVPSLGKFSLSKDYLLWRLDLVQW